MSLECFFSSTSIFEYPSKSIHTSALKMNAPFVLLFLNHLTKNYSVEYFIC